MDLPQDFLIRMKALLGGEFPSFLDSYGETRRYGLRVNTLKISVEAFRSLAPFHLTPIPWTDNGFFYEKEDAPSRHPFYYAGLYYLQEPSAMTPAQVLPVTPGDRVLDLCAAPGGKATALAAKLAGEGMLVANDISVFRAKALLKNLELFGVRNAFVTNEVPAKLAERYPAFFDKILVDAPCSGEGMFRKDIANAHAWSLDKVRECAKIQKEIAVRAASMLRPGGMMLYSTCTFSPEEDEQVIAYLLEHCPELELLPVPMAEGFEKGRPGLAEEDWMTGKAGREERFPDLVKCVRLFPHKIPGEGHFLALLGKRAAGEPCRESGAGEGDTDKEDLFAGAAADWEKTGKKKKKDKREKGRLQREHRRMTPASSKAADRTENEWVASFLREQNQMEYLKSLDMRKERAYYVPEQMRTSEEPDGIRFLRNGLYLGEVKKDRFEPSQALAMALRPKDGTAILDFDCTDERILRYLRGETLEVEDLLTDEQGQEASDQGCTETGERSGAMRKHSGSAAANGWRLVCVNGFPLGWGRLTGSTLKNKYHPGWRLR
ncbi:MAG: RsmB/NOP family class I SAM-dependent RNA methyltransferase [Lachnospiraceae bacterium]|nr:RsmB/NOP family class I SAM-dependent RNA methyltransferase [Lachnospiraceae bacterium]